MGRFIRVLVVVCGFELGMSLFQGLKVIVEAVLVGTYWWNAGILSSKVVRTSD